MKTGRESSSRSEGSSSRGDWDFVEVESGSDLQGDNQQYRKYDVNKFLDNVLTGLGTDDVKRLGKVLRKACQERDLVQLVRGVLHLVELYQAGKGPRSRPRSTAVGRTAPSKNSKKGTRPSVKAVGERRRHHGVVPQRQRGNTVVDLTEERAGTSAEAERSNENEGQDDAGKNEDLQDLESIISNREDALPPDENGEEFSSEEEQEQEQEGGNNNTDHVNANTFNEDEQVIEESSSLRSRLLLIPEDESSLSDTSRLDPSYPEGARTFKRKRGNRKETSQKKNKVAEKNVPTNTHRGGDSSSSSETDVSQEEDSLSDSSRTDQAFKRRRRIRKPSPEDISSTEGDASRDIFSRQEARSANKARRTHKCPVCKKMWLTKSQLEIHSRTHTGERPFPCPRPNCGKKYSQKGALDAHLRSHEGVKRYKCPYPRCKKAFAYWSALDAHKRVHTGVMPFKCKFPGCFKEFAAKDRLKTHERVHTRPFKCLFQGCGLGFGAKRSLQTHQRKHKHN